MKASATQQLECSADAAWAVIAQGGGVHRWFSGAIATCSLTGAGEGAARSCTMLDGSQLEERILSVDHGTRTFRYAIDTHPLPATNVVATIDFSKTADGKTQGTWRAQFDASPEDADGVKSQLETLYTGGLQSLDQYLLTQP